ncbi:DUF4352 domain-containing protein [Verrucosispora sioxanthis]|uniref:DUF4352 domain-containing protein n=1 Tax=Verrucosispora sioxanthis TaxID=2499994 RepID=A0A6M1L444_9ACTN|nr:DUF4352 domain-containing protein [Verrucosispora sioxanthis]NEE63810.1 DUF4352 domain-containing protein [Verrucosispora sioxanthis]NGM12920.1 DUF4352 domain-containing protein [Verrucosispora sioxanthis]
MRKTTTFTLLATALIALGCGAGATDEGGSAGNGDTAAKSEDKPKTAKIGQAVRDGKFEFTVKSNKCGVRKVGSDLLGDKAQGQFCLVTVNVKNIGKEPQTLLDSSQKAYDADGTEYSTDSEAAIYANEDQQTLFAEINPGNQVTGVLVFDIPKKVKLTKLELHDSPFSGGVEVSLS